MEKYHKLQNVETYSMNAKKKYRQSDRGKINNKFNRRINKWKKLGYNIKTDFITFLNKWNRTDSCEECKEETNELFMHLDKGSIKRKAITIGSIKLICKECLYAK